MQPDQIGGILGGVVGGLVGIAGGAIGMYCSIRHVKGPRERQFLIRTSIIAWVGFLVFLATLFALPSPWRHLLWMPYGFLLLLGIVVGNRKIGAIRREEADDRNDPPKDE